MISAPNAAVHGDRYAEAVRARMMDELGVRQPARFLERDGHCFAHATPALHAGGEGVIESAPGFLGHPERAVAKTGGDVLGRSSESRDLVVVNRGGAVHSRGA
jgi:hypothetical protein